MKEKLDSLEKLEYECPNFVSPGNTNTRKIADKYGKRLFLRHTRTTVRYGTRYLLYESTSTYYQYK